MHRLLIFALLGSSLAQLSTINDAIGRFSIELLKRTLVDNQNTIHSAYSIWSALGMCLIGSQDTTTTNMEDGMFISDMSLPDFEHSMKQSTDRLMLASKESDEIRVTKANRIYVAHTFPVGETYLRALRYIFEADAVNVNFEEDGDSVMQAINTFVNTSTNGLIPQLLDTMLDRGTKIALVNALYFKGYWQHRMILSPSDRRFNADIDGGQAADWLFEKQRFAYENSPELQAEIISIPYRNHPNSEDHSSMVIILPHDTHKNNIATWIEHFLDWHSISKAVTTMNHALVALTMPKFGVEANFELSETLKNNLGMTVPFSGEANFDGMVDSGHAVMSISRVIHEAKMTVNENGTEAAAATLIIGMAKSSLNLMPEPEPIVLNIDRSFVAFIMLRQDQSVVPLFTSVINRVA